MKKPVITHVPRGIHSIAEHEPLPVEEQVEIAKRFDRAMQKYGAAWPDMPCTVTIE